MSQRSNANRSHGQCPSAHRICHWPSLLGYLLSVSLHRKTNHSIIKTVRLVRYNCISPHIGKCGKNSPVRKWIDWQMSSSNNNSARARTEFHSYPINQSISFVRWFRTLYTIGIHSFSLRCSVSKHWYNYDEWYNQNFHMLYQHFSKELNTPACVSVVFCVCLHGRQMCRTHNYNMYNWNCIC